MKLDPQQFAQRGREAARQLRDALAGRRLVERFVDSYAAAHDRSGLRESPLRYRELLITINRESWLAMAARLEALLPGKISPRRPAAMRGAEEQAVDAFRESFLEELGAVLHWMPSDRAEFSHDLILYAQIAERQPRAMRAGSGSAVAQGAFVDRCALLLDPSLFDKARAAAGTLLVSLEALAEEVLEEVLPSRAAGKSRPPAKKKKPARRK